MALTDSQSKEFIRLVTEHQAELFYYLLSLVPNRVDAEEILQDTHLYLWEHFDEFTPNSNFRAWAFQIAYHRVLKFFHQQQRRRQLFSDQFLTHLASTAIELPRASISQHDALDDCLAKLTPRDRALLDVRYRLGQTMSEIAQSLNRNVDAAYRALRRIHHVLFECVQRKLAAEEDA